VKQYKRIRYRTLSDGTLCTPNFIGTHEAVRGFIKDNLVEIYTLDGIKLFFQLCASELEAKTLMKEQLAMYGVRFLDEVRYQ
jgi:hypothetical protein